MQLTCAGVRCFSEVYCKGQEVTHHDFHRKTKEKPHDAATRQKVNVNIRNKK